jgi:O-acetyl-ADP-ribose deacetylase (regulator of RNase III)
MLLERKGNLIDLAVDGEFDVIVHGCNCQNTMGSGIAREIRERFPEAYRADRLMYAQTGGGRHMLGNYSEVSVSEPFIGARQSFVIVNAYTQVGYLPRGKDHFEYKSFDLILQKLLYYYGDKRIGFPFIGMGLAGGDVQTIKSMIADFAKSVADAGGSVTLVEFG